MVHSSTFKFRASLSGLILLSFLLTACHKNEDHPPPPTGGYQYTSGDTVITIPAAAVSFAQHNFSRDAQLLREFQIATNSQYVNPIWTLPLNSWKQTSFDQRQSYMVSPYDNDVTTTDSALFYYEIGTYFTQFGYGWKDTFDTTTFHPDSAYVIHLWPTDPIQTVGFDGESAFIEQYRSMWRFQYSFLQRKFETDLISCRAISTLLRLSVVALLGLPRINLQVVNLCIFSTNQFYRGINGSVFVLGVDRFFNKNVMLHAPINFDSQLNEELFHEDS